MITIYCDGLCEPNPGGTLCWAFVALDPGGAVVHSAAGHHRPAALNTNNRAEIGAILRALQWAHHAGQTDLVVYSDSQLAVRYLTEGGTHPALAPLADQARALAPRGTRFVWIPGSENSAADGLTRTAFRRATGREATDWSKVRRQRHTPTGDAA